MSQQSSVSTDETKSTSSIRSSLSRERSQRKQAHRKGYRHDDASRCCRRAAKRLNKRTRSQRASLIRNYQLDSE